MLCERRPPGAAELVVESRFRVPAHAGARVPGAGGVFDLLEAAHTVPSMYTAVYNAASGASAAAAPAALASVSGGASVAAGSDSAASGCPAGSSSSSTTEARGPGAAAPSTSTAAPTQLAFGGHACSAGAPAAAAADTPMTAPAVAAAMAPRAAPLHPASGGHAHAAVAPLLPASVATPWPTAPSLPFDVPPPPGIVPPPSPPPKAFSGSAEAPSHALPAAPAAAAAIPPEVAPLDAPPPAAAPGIAAPPAAAAGSAPPAEHPVDDGRHFVGGDSGPESDLEDEDARPRERRTRPRSRSRSRPRSGADAASGAREPEEEDDVDLRSRLSERQVAGLSDAKKAELRQVVRKDEKQQHICDQRESWQQNPFAASGANMPQRDEKHARDMETELDRYCEPIPERQDFLTGVRHKNDDPEKEGQLWDVVRALASKKVHYKARLNDAVWGGLGAASGAPAPFCEAYPDAVLGDGWTALTPEALEATKHHLGIADDAEYVKHILHKHDGEVRHWGKEGQLWDVVRALASKKVHYRARLVNEVWSAASGAPAPFCEAYPDAVLGSGWTA